MNRPVEHKGLPPLSRRRLLQLGAASAGSLLLAGCGGNGFGDFDIGLGGSAPFLTVVRLQPPLLFDILSIKYREYAAGFSEITPAKAGTAEHG